MMAPYAPWEGHPPKTPRSDVKGLWERFWEWFDDNLLLVDYGWRSR